jgi:hypothetical protein
MWMTKKRGGTQLMAHFIVDGVSLCSTLTDKEGPRLAAFKSSFEAFEEWSHLCTLCQRAAAKARIGEPKQCACGKCRVASRLAAR